MQTVIIQGSSRSDGNTGKIASLLKSQLQGDLIDLKDKAIAPYDYEYKNQGDDFLPLIKEVVEYDLIVFVTPVYWYTMSGIMKNFFDRISDCVRIEKELGRKLGGKSMATVACGSGSEEIEGFFIPFMKSAEYLKMEYVGSLHAWVDGEGPSKEVVQSIEIFVDQIKSPV